MGCTNCNQSNPTGNCNCSDPIPMPIGPTGPQGPTGPHGPTGTAGSNGTHGTNGTNGTNGINAYTYTTASFVMPLCTSISPTATVTISVVDLGVFAGSWATTGQMIYVQGAGYMLVVSSTANSITISNPCYPGNATAGTIISTNAEVSPAGLLGPTGPSGLTPFHLNYRGINPTAPSSPSDLDFYYNSTVGGSFFYDASSSSWQPLALDGSQGSAVTTNIGTGGANITINSSSARQQILTSTGAVTLTGNVVVAMGSGVFTPGYTVTVIYNANLLQSTGTVTIFGILLNNAQATSSNLTITNTYDGTTWHPQLVS